MTTTPGLGPSLAAPAAAAPVGRHTLRTVGIEEEMLLVDPRTGRAVPAGPSVARRAHGDALLGDLPGGAEPVGTELQQEQVETATPPRTSLDDLVADLRALRRTADDAARGAGARVAALATYPLPIQPVLTPGPRYRAIGRRLGLTADEQLTCGCHVHVAVDGDDEGVAVLDRIRPWLPVLTALTTSSPFWQGADTGYAGFRTQVWNRLPGTGPTDVFGSVAGYRAAVATLLDTGTALDEGMIYFDARLSARYPTVEVRVADVCLDPHDAVLVAALVRGLVDTAASEWRAGVTAPADPTSLLRAAAWQASRWGLEADLVDPVEHLPRPAGDVVARLVDHVADALRASGDLRFVERVTARLLAEGTGARRQREVLRSAGRLEDVVAYAVEATGR